MKEKKLRKLLEEQEQQLQDARRRNEQGNYTMTNQRRMCALGWDVAHMTKTKGTEWVPLEKFMADHGVTIELVEEYLDNRPTAWLEIEKRTGLLKKVRYFGRMNSAGEAAYGGNPPFRPGYNPIHDPRLKPA
jgi:hypothetical protein